MPHTPPQGEGWTLAYEDSDKRVWVRPHPEDGTEDTHTEWVNPNAPDARLEDLEGRVTDLEGGAG